MAKTKSINWQDMYEVVGITPGLIYHPQTGEIDLSKTDIPLETIDKLYAAGCPFVKLKSAIVSPTDPIV